MPYSLSQHSKDILSTVDQKMQDLASCVASKFPYQLIVTRGLCTAEEEMTIWLKCHYPDGEPNGQPHLTSCNGYKKGIFAPNGSIGTGESNHQSGDAIDVVIQKDSVIIWNGQDPLYSQLNDTFQAAGKELGVPVFWGGTFSTPDWDHFSLVAG